MGTLQRAQFASNLLGLHALGLAVIQVSIARVSKALLRCRPTVRKHIVTVSKPADECQKYSRMPATTVTVVIQTISFALVLSYKQGIQVPLSAGGASSCVAGSLLAAAVTPASLEATSAGMGDVTSASSKDCRTRLLFDLALLSVHWAAQTHDIA